MNRLALVLPLLLWAACSSNKPADTPAAPDSAPAATAPATTAPAPAAEPAAAPEAPVQITEELVKKYLELQKGRLELIKAELVQWKKELADLGPNPGVAKASEYIAATERHEKRIEEGEKALIAKSGLTAGEAEKLADAVSDVSSERLAWNMGGEKALKELEAQLKVQMDALPPAEREAFKAQAQEMTASLTKARDAAAARKKYGDAAVDAILKYDKELTSMFEQSMKMLGEMQ